MTIEILPADATLPALRVHRPERLAERTRWVARPGLRGLPSGAMTLAAFVGLQVWTLVILLWAVWWPAPRGPADLRFCVGVTGVFVLLIAGVVTLMLRRHPGFVVAVLRAPFIRLTVTDRRIVWSLPWRRGPLMEIGHERVVGGIVGDVDRRGAGNAAVMLVPGDPCADIDGAIHFDRLPDAAGFVNALRAA